MGASLSSLDWKHLQIPKRKDSHAALNTRSMSALQKCSPMIAFCLTPLFVNTITQLFFHRLLLAGAPCSSCRVRVSSIIAKD
jgi:hypothetical protein